MNNPKGSSPNKYNPTNQKSLMCLVTNKKPPPPLSFPISRFSHYQIDPHLILNNMMSLACQAIYRKIQNRRLWVERISLWKITLVFQDRDIWIFMKEEDITLGCPQGLNEKIPLIVQNYREVNINNSLHKELLYFYRIPI